MLDFLWNAGLIVASLWGTGSFEINQYSSDPLVRMEELLEPTGPAKAPRRTPQYFPPSLPYPLQKELDSELDAAHQAEESKLDVREKMTLDDVAKMAKLGVSDKIIIRQIEATNSVFRLRTPDIITLRQQGVSNRVIDLMQTRGSNSEPLQLQRPHP